MAKVLQDRNTQLRRHIAVTPLS